MVMHSPVKTVALTSVLILSVGCADRGTPPPDEPEIGPDPAAAAVPANAGLDAAPAVSSPQAELAALRRATSRFHRIEAATDAGYTVLVEHPETGAVCLEHPTDGGMGRHMLNPALVDDAVSVAEPEVVIYEPMGNGEMRLVGVEYIIPYSILGPDETPPTLFGRDFLHNPTFGLWMLHVYAWKHNEAGMFATWNPSITCEHDDAVG